MAERSSVKNFVDGLTKPFADMKMRKTALFSKFLSVISAIEDVQKSSIKTLATGITKVLRNSNGDIVANEIKGKVKRAATPRKAKEVKAFNASEVASQVKAHRIGEGGTSALPSLSDYIAAEKLLGSTPTTKGKQSSAKGLNVSHLAAEKLTVETLDNKGEEKKKRAGKKSPEEKALEIQEKQYEMQDRALTLEEDADKLEERQAALEKSRWDKTLPGMLHKQATEVGDHFSDGAGELSKQFFGPLHDTAVMTKNLAVNVLKRFKLKDHLGFDSIKAKLIDGQRWLAQKATGLRQTKIFKAMEKSLVELKILQKAQAAIQTFLQPILSVMQNLMGAVFSIFGSLAKELAIGALAIAISAAVGKALGDLWKNVIQPTLPDWLQSSEQKGSNFDYEQARLKQIQGKDLTADETKILEEHAKGKVGMEGGSDTTRFVPPVSPPGSYATVRPEEVLKVNRDMLPEGDKFDAAIIDKITGTFDSFSNKFSKWLDEHTGNSSVVVAPTNAVSNNSTDSSGAAVGHNFMEMLSAPPAR